MEAGCHVLVEKPMAVNVEEAEAMEAAARRHGVKLCVDHNHLLIRRRKGANASGANNQNLVSVEAFEGFFVRAPGGPYQPGAADPGCISAGASSEPGPAPVYLLLAFLNPRPARWRRRQAAADLVHRRAPGFVTASRPVFHGRTVSLVSTYVYGTVCSRGSATNSMTLARNRDLPRASLRDQDRQTQLLGYGKPLKSPRSAALLQGSAFSSASSKGIGDRPAPVVGERREVIASRLVGESGLL
jgi:hypothetical protein